MAVKRLDPDYLTKLKKKYASVLGQNAPIESAKSASLEPDGPPQSKTPPPVKDL